MTIRSTTSRRSSCRSSRTFPWCAGKTTRMADRRPAGTRYLTAVSMTRSVSVVINTFNRRDSLERTLRSLEWLDYPNFEVVVVNGPSTDGTDELLDSIGGPNQERLLLQPQSF